MQMMLHLNFVIIQLVSFVSSIDDYWSNDFDSSKNCKSEDEVRELQNGKNQCSQVKVEDNGDEEAFQVCVHKLNQLLGKKCEKSEVDNPGKLLYCKSRGQIICCFKGEKCKSWIDINNKIFLQAKAFLENTTSFLNFCVD